MGARHQQEHQQTDPAVFPQKPGLLHHHTTGDRHRHEAIEQQTQKTTWIFDSQSGILQVRRCISNLNPQTIDKTEKELNIALSQFYNTRLQQKYNYNVTLILQSSHPLNKKY